MPNEIDRVISSSKKVFARHESILLEPVQAAFLIFFFVRMKMMEIGGEDERGGEGGERNSTYS